MSDARVATRTTAAGTVLLTLAAGQFLMTLDSSVMNVSIATVAKDLGTTVTGIQTAITLYTLVMASLMITGGKVGAIIGRQRAFSIGCVIYARGLAHHRARAESRRPDPRLVVPRGNRCGADHAGDRRVGRVELRDEGAPARLRPRRLGGCDRGRGRTAHRRARHDVLSRGGGLRRRGHHRAVILLLARRIADAPPAEQPHLDLVGTVLSASGLALFVFGVLRSGTWGWVQPKPTAPAWLGLSPTIWLMLAGRLRRLGVLRAGRRRLVARGREPLVDPDDARQPAAPAAG